MAAASMAQVHCATLHDGTAVIVKVQRPGIAATVEADISVLRRLARLAGGLMPSLRAFNLPELVEELAETLRGELDFEREGRNAERFAELNRAEPAVFVPRIFWEATTRRVLTMEHSPGQRIDESADPAARPGIARELMRLFLTHVFEHGLFHADPHPGNLFLHPDGRICFHDFGAIGDVSPRDAQALREWKALAEGHKPADAVETAAKPVALVEQPAVEQPQQAEKAPEQAGSGKVTADTTAKKGRTAAVLAARVESREMATMRAPPLTNCIQTRMQRSRPARAAAPAPANLTLQLPAVYLH
jgi:predicted unusual protein kinase regulating ubiquinone biosynthesis (AarF/ABC1/UbiB family)